MKKCFIVCLFSIIFLSLGGFVYADDSLDITYLSDSFTLFNNEQWSITCIGSGSNDITYQWYFKTFNSDTFNIVGDNYFIGGNTQTLTVVDNTSLFFDNISGIRPVYFKCLLKSGELIKESNIITVSYSGSNGINENTGGFNLIFNYVSAFFNQFMLWVKDIGNIIVSTPLLLLTIGFFVLGGSIGIFRRLLSKN